MGGVQQPERVTTGIAGLDALLAGGVLKGTSVVVTGGPGSGKTVLCCQVAFHRAALGEQVVYVSTFAESHARLLQNLSSLAFFDDTLVGTRVTLQSAIPTLEAGGIEALLGSLHELVRKRQVSLLVVDSLLSVADTARTEYEFRRFLRELGTVMGMNGCTALLVAPEVASRVPVEQYICDGVLALHHEHVGLRETRELEVTKFRGGRVLGGLHTGLIDSSGWVVYPRIESLPLPTGGLVRPSEEPTRFGIAGLDEMLRGGLRSGAVTALMGAPGSGKTILGLSYLAEGLARGESAAYFGFNEQPERLLGKGEAVGLRLAPHVASGALTCVWRQPVEQLLDALGHELLDLVRTRRPARLFLDGVDGLLMGVAHPDRFAANFAALMNHLRRLGVSTIASVETPFLGPVHELPDIALSASVENVLFLRYVEVRSRLHRLVSIMKVRESGYDPSLREFGITAEGVQVAADNASAEELLGRRVPAVVPADVSRDQAAPVAPGDGDEGDA